MCTDGTVVRTIQQNSKEQYETEHSTREENRSEKYRIKQDTAQYSSRSKTKGSRKDYKAKMKKQKIRSATQMVSVSHCCWPCLLVSLVIQRAPPSHPETRQTQFKWSFLLLFFSPPFHNISLQTWLWAHIKCDIRPWSCCGSVLF